MQYNTMFFLNSIVIFERTQTEQFMLGRKMRNLRKNDLVVLDFTLDLKVKRFKVKYYKENHGGLGVIIGKAPDYFDRSADSHRYFVENHTGITNNFHEKSLIWIGRIPPKKKPKPRAKRA